MLPDVTLDDIIEKTKKMLDKNYREINKEEEIDTTDLKDICTMVSREAAEYTNRFAERQLQEVLNDCWPIIVKCSCMAYMNRGAEGLGSQSELGQQNVYNDWVDTLHKQITNRRYVI